ncbi:MAG: phosphodiester glycosidase family protein [Thermotogaceae bacterium]|jgi:exopolysaccharide biosynthesis protein|nr:phosphodiester glycosidase family protein [Mesotoga sp.]MDI9376218.1 phosphodiester glycosidase family protein [Thermotogota bacterium]NLX33317.1 phosphodiester glycosidase family protein [Thermotogaceae bacterium]MDD4477986.1 phosphodiester glycosidase family protein [Mesotoga sp.]MDD5743142.1 phosphodiester glycosidase family protein [Mesotoga sp.]
MRRIFLLLFIVACLTALSKNLVYLDERGQMMTYDDVVISTPSGEFVSIEIIDKILKGVVISQSLRQEETIMILPSGAIVSFSHKTSRATVEFGNEFDNALLIRDGVAYINSELLSVITRASIFSETDSLVLYSQPLRIKKIDNQADSIRITLDRKVLPDFITYWWTGSGSLAITLRPAMVDPLLDYDEVSISSGRDFVRLVFEKPWGDIEYEIDGLSVIFRNKSGLGRTVQIETASSYSLSLYESYVDGRRFSMSYLEMNPEKFVFSVELASNGIAGLEKASDILNRRKSEIMINGGYFDQNQNLPIGLLIRNGEVLGLPSLGRPALYVTDKGRVYVSRMDIIYLAEIGGRTVQITGVNSPYRGEVVLYTDEYRNTLPEFDDFQYLVIENSGRVISKGYVSFARQGTNVLVLSPSAVQKSGNVSVGSTVKFKLLNSYGENLVSAVEGGPMIIHDGAPVSDYERNYYSSSLIDVRAPRTLVGVKETGEIVFIVIDGYQQSSYGLSMKEMIEFFRDKGFDSLMCLDGGKSSIMMVEGKVVNTPSSGIPSLPVVIMGTRK